MTQSTRRQRTLAATTWLALAAAAVAVAPLIALAGQRVDPVRPSSSVVPRSDACPRVLLTASVRDGRR